MSFACLARLPSVSIAEKAEIVQRFYEQAAFHPSGIMYSMQRMDHESVRPFTPADLEGQYFFSFDKWRLKPDGPWDYLHNENSITTSGIYLAAQSYRFQASADEAARREAGRAFQSLNLIYELGERDGRPGWMGKPYSWRVSDETSPDQYLDASWGLSAYHPIASAAERRRIEEMFVGFADYWRRVDYTITYFGHPGDLKPRTDDNNLFLIMLNAMAWRFTRSKPYLDEAKRFCGIGTWHKETNIDIIKRSRLKSETHQHLDTVFKDYIRPGETICWEANIHNKFTVTAIENILTAAPELIENVAQEAISRWWEIWRYGVGEDFMPYYWYAVDVQKDTWRPLPKTPVTAPWWLDDRFCNYLSQVRWMEPLARFMYTSVVAARHAPAVAADARKLCLRIMEKIDAQRLRWMVDLDGQQLLPELAYMGGVLSSEVAPSFLAAYWRGRCENLW